LQLEQADAQQLQQWVSAFGTPQQVALRSRIVLAAAAGQSDSAIARGLAVNRKTVTLWRERFAQGGLDSMWEVAAGRGRKPSYGPRKIAAIVSATLTTKPKGMTQWSCRQLAEAQGVSKSTVHNIWQSHQLQPHRDKTFKLSRDAKFLEKLTDVVGLYLNPPQQALVLCVDEKTQIQALDRTQPGLPMKKGRCGTMTHDYKRNGTATLFAAMNTLDGSVISMCDDRHRHQEWLKFLRVIDNLTPPGKELHLIADNYATHKHPKVQKWLERHPRFHMHFTPTSSSWLNMVERFFRDLTQNRLRRGIFRDVEELILAIGDYIDKHNHKPKPFVWTAKAADILEKVKRARTVLDNG
jgi:transposase